MGPRLAPPVLSWLCSIRAEIGGMHEFTSAHGVNRALFPITGGELDGEGLAGQILPGGADFARGLPDGSYAIEARYFVRLVDGTLLGITNAGRMRLQPDGSYLGRTRAEIDAPAGRFGWLNDRVIFGTALAEAGDDAQVFIELWLTD